MPPKASSSKHHNTSKVPSPSKEQLEAIKEYLAQKPDFEKAFSSLRTDSQIPFKDIESEYERILRKAVVKTFEERRTQAEVRNKRAIMPVLPKEEETKGNLTDQVAKESKDSAASNHPLHDKSDKPSFEHYKAAPGPVMPNQNKLPEAEDSETLRAKAAELNKKT